MAEKIDEEKGKKLGEKTDELLLSLFNALSDYDAKKTKDEHAMDDFKMYLIDQAIANAYKDATNQGAFNTILYKEYEFEDYKQKHTECKSEKEAKRKFKEDHLQLNDNKEKAMDEMEKAFKVFLDSNVCYCDWHSGLCKNIMDSYQNVKKAFTYGNAQKWVNMAVKYLYVYASLLERMDEFSNKNPFCNLLDQKDNLHVPIDSYVLKAVFNDDKRKDLLEKNLVEKDRVEKDNLEKYLEKYNYANKDGKLCFKVEEGKKNECHIIGSCETCFEQGSVDNNDNNLLPCGKAKRLNSDYVLTWSKIGSYDDYRLIQEKIKEIIPKDMSPLEWENKVWLEMAVKS